MKRPVFPFAAMVGQNRAKMALVLSAIDPNLGGVLISGPKGSGKSTIVRALGDVLPEIEYVEGCPFNCGPGDLNRLCPSCKERLAGGEELPVERRHMRIVELPLGASEEALLGAIDPEAALTRGIRAIQPGILARANRNILYIDEVNLLPEHLVDCILDPAASGWNVVQREGMSLSHPARFTLIATMNPEEGGLRPQILDRFALKVETENIVGEEDRKELVRRNLAFEDNPTAFMKTYEEKQDEIRSRIQMASESLRSVRVTEAVMRGVAEVCSKLGVEGLRSDLSALKAARALSAYEGRDSVEASDVREVFELALRHRIRGVKPSDRPLIDRKTLESLIMDEESNLLEGEELEEMLRFELKPMPSKAVRRRRRRISSPWASLLNILAMVAMLVSLAVVSTMTLILFQVMALGLPIEWMTTAFTPRRFLTNLAIVTVLFALLNLISFRRRGTEFIVYFSKYLVPGLMSQVVRQHEQRAQEEGAKRQVIVVSKILSVPLYASLRRLYKIILSKGAKLLKAGLGEERRRYRFSVGRRADRRLRGGVGRQSKTKARSQRGRYVSYEFPKRRPWDVALGPTIRAAAPFQLSRDRRGLAMKVDVEDVRVKVREMRAPVCMVLLLDMSESMTPSLPNVMNAILSMQDIALKRRDRLGLTIFKGEAAVTLQTPTTNLALVVSKLKDVGASDLTPLASGMFEARRVLRNERARNREMIPFLVIISDGIVNIPLESPLTPSSRQQYINHAQADVIDAARLLRGEGIWTLVINPSHLPEEEKDRRYKQSVMKNIGKIWMAPKELLVEVPRITGGYYYGIGEHGELEEAILTEAFSIIGR
jgi:Mg-chelatase subunit ChlI/Mg-chelatase subunit ChlD